MFINKSENLKILLSKNLKRSKIPKFIDFNVKEWTKTDKNILINKIKKNLSNRICIRSSFALEDKTDNSLAGKFESYLNVSNTSQNIIKYVNKIVTQYSKFDKNNVENSNIFIQNYLSDSILSGVVTNFNLHDGSPYYVINYDDTTNLTDTVTSGGKSGFRALYVYKNKLNNVKSKRFRPLVLAIKEIEKKFNYLPIDIEFAVDKKLNVHIFQIRPISTKKNWKTIKSSSFGLKLNQLGKKFLKLEKKNSKYNKKAVFGLMPDWNPVEMIGSFPGKLSYSLYKKLITKNSWSIARKEMEYKNIKSDLMYNFSGRPYIDVRLSFNSFLPKNLGSNLSKKITNHWCDILINNPYLHDKIEFEIADSCYDFSLENKINKNYHFLNKSQKKDYFKKIKSHTYGIINNYEENFISYFKDLKELENYRVNLIKKVKNKENINLKKVIIETIQALKKKGIIPFSKFARNAFIGKKILDNLKLKNIIRLNDYKKILNSLDTVTSLFTKLEKKIYYSKYNKKLFYSLFFHLRPGTYDIEVNRYRPQINTYEINNINEILSLSSTSSKLLGVSKIKKIQKYLDKNKFKLDAIKLLNYAVSSMKLRENSKYIFTRTLSDLLELLKIYGQSKGLKKTELSELTIDEILKTNLIKIDNKLKKHDKTNFNANVQLPFLINSKKDFFVCSIQEVKPNFITYENVRSKCVKLNNNLKNKNLKNRIVLIENADPGYDWIFSKNIKGLITKNGGINSHMSIRCQELNIPAAIGLGEYNFNLLKSNFNINLNCKLNKINILNTN